jgi:hypothetical protein
MNPFVYLVSQPDVWSVVARLHTCAAADAVVLLVCLHMDSHDGSSR